MQYNSTSLGTYLLAIIHSSSIAAEIIMVTMPLSTCKVHASICSREESTYIDVKLSMASKSPRGKLVMSLIARFLPAPKGAEALSCEALTTAFRERNKRTDPLP